MAGRTVVTRLIMIMIWKDSDILLAEKKRREEVVM